MDKRINFAVASLLSILLLAACGGGSGNSQSQPTTYSLSGRVVKGPLAVGSTISVNELDSTLNPTGKTYSTQTSDALGSFSVSSRVGSQYAEIVAQGFFLDETTGKLSDSQITLRAIADLNASNTPTINVLTTLQEPRLKALVAQGHSFSDAYSQSANEVLAIFGIGATKIQSFSSLTAMRIDQNSDADAALLASSVVLLQIANDTALANGTSSAAELANILGTLSSQIANSGAVTSTTFNSARMLAESEVNVTEVTSNLQSYYSDHGSTVTLPKFQEWLDPSNSNVLPQRTVDIPGLTFSDLSGAVPGETVTSSTYTITGLGNGVFTSVSVSDGSVLMKNGAAVKGPLSVATDGDKIALRTTAPGYLVKTSISITVGASTATWHVTGEALNGTITGLTGAGLTLKDSGGSSLSITAGSTSFSFTDAIPLGSVYNISVTAAPTSPTQSCVVTNGSGTVGTAQGAIRVVCQLAQEFLIVSDGNGKAAVFTIDDTTGALTAAGAATTITTSSLSMTSHPKNAFVYFADAAHNLVYGYAIDASSSKLVSVPGSPLTTSVSPSNGLTIEPTGAFLYSGTQSGMLGFSINPTTGSLALISGSPFAPAQIGSSPVPANLVNCNLFCASTGTHIYVPLYSGAGAYNFGGYTIDSATGALTNPAILGPSTCCTVHASTFIDTGGHFFYLVSNGVESSYSIDSSGALQLIGTATDPSGAGTPIGITLDRNGKFAYLLHDSGQITSFTINSSSGTLTATMLKPNSSVQSASKIFFDISGKFLYATGTASIAAFSFDSGSGTLTPVSGSPFVIGIDVTDVSAVKIQN